MTQQESQPARSRCDLLAFVHVRKTGGSTVDTILRQSFLGRHLRVRLGPDRALNPVASAREIARCRLVYWRLRCVSGHGIVPYADLQERYPNIRFFTFLREPLARCASDYQFRVVRGGLKTPFEQWIRSEYADNQQTRKLAGVPDANLAIQMLNQRVRFVGVLESFNESLVRLARWAEPSKLDIRYRAKNVASNNSLKKRLLADPKTRAMLAAANGEDVKLYQFVVNEYLPKSRREYGPQLAEDVATFVRNNRPLPVYPRQLPSMLAREVIYKPLAPLLRDRCNPDGPPARRRAA